jgi:hypothetical protein
MPSNGIVIRTKEERPRYRTSQEIEPMLVTMQNSELVRKLVKLAKGDLDLVQEAINASARNGAADLEAVVDYIVKHRERALAVA